MMHRSRFRFRFLRLLVPLVLLGGGSMPSRVLGFEIVSKTRGRPQRFVDLDSEATAPRQGLVPAVAPRGRSGSSLFLLLLRGRGRHHESDDLPADDDCGESEGGTEEGYYSYDRRSSEPAFSNLLEYKEHRDPVQVDRQPKKNRADRTNTPSTQTQAFVDAMNELNLKKIASVNQVYDLAVRKNLPKKKPISMHSFVSTLSAMASVLLLVPTFHPGIDDLGLPRLFTYEYASNELLWQSQLVAILQMVGSILGVFRLPKNSPPVRTAGFLIAAMIVVQMSIVVISNLNGTDVYLFDAFSMQGRILSSVINTTLLIGSFDNLTSILGDKDQRGWETVPNYQNKLSAFALVFPIHVLICISGNAILPVLCDKESFVQNALPFYGIFPGLQTVELTAISLSVGLGSLLATLQFERKIDAGVATGLNLALLLFLNYDGVKFMYLLLNFPERFAYSEYFTTYTPHLQSVWHTNEALVAGTLLAVLLGWRDYLKKKNTAPLVSSSPVVTNAATSADPIHRVVADIDQGSMVSDNGGTGGGGRVENPDSSVQ